MQTRVTGRETALKLFEFVVLVLIMLTPILLLIIVTTLLLLLKVVTLILLILILIVLVLIIVTTLLLLVTPMLLVQPVTPAPGATHLLHPPAPAGAGGHPEEVGHLHLEVTLVVVRNVMTPSVVVLI